MDEVPVYFDLPRNHTVDFKGLHTIRIQTTGHEHLRFTVVLTALGNGTKLKPMIIFKGLKNVPNEKFPQGIHITVSKGGSMSATLLENEYVPNVWQRRPGPLFNNDALMTWDSHASHKDPTVLAILKRQKTSVVFIPSGMTPILQPLDVCINKPFKDALKEKWETWMADGEIEYTRGGKRKRASYALVANWVSEAWQSLPRDAIRSAFGYCGIQRGGTPFNELHARLASLVQDGTMPEPGEVVEISETDSETDSDSE